MRRAEVLLTLIAISRIGIRLPLSSSYLSMMLSAMMVVMILVRLATYLWLVYRKPKN